MTKIRLVSLVAGAIATKWGLALPIPDFPCRFGLEFQHFKAVFDSGPEALSMLQKCGTFRIVDQVVQQMYFG